MYWQAIVDTREMMKIASIWPYDWPIITNSPLCTLTVQVHSITAIWLVEDITPNKIGVYVCLQ